MNPGNGATSANGIQVVQGLPAGGACSLQRSIHCLLFDDFDGFNVSSKESWNHRGERKSKEELGNFHCGYFSGEHDLDEFSE